MFEVEDIKKSFKTKEVLKGVSFSIDEGDKVALLGNNGAGKSTLLKIIAGQLTANSGEINTSLDFQTEIGMMPQGDILIDDLTVSDLVYLKSKMNQIDNINVDEFSDMVELRDFKNHYVSGLSGGQKRRLSLLLTILNSPKLIFLDEPTTGMDLESVDNFWKLLENQNFTSVVVTHDFNQIDHFFTKVLILKDGILTHVYTQIISEIPNNAPQTDKPEAKATVYVNEAGETVKTPDEGLHDGPKAIDDKWEYVRTIPEKDGILTHVYTKITSEIPNNPPIVDIPEAKATRYVNTDGVDIKTPDEGLHDGPKVINDKWQYVKTIPEKDGILTHVYTVVKYNIPNNPPVVEIPEAKATVYINEQGDTVKTPDEGLHDGPKVINDKWQYVKTIPEKDGILTHVYTEITHSIPNNPPIVDIPEAKATVYVDENGNNVKIPDEGLHDGPKVIEDKWQYVKTIPEKDGILTHVYTTITHEIPNNPPIVDIPELEVTRYIDEHGKDIKDPEPGTKEAPKTIGKYEFSRTIPKKDGVTTHVYKEVKRETPNKPTPNTDKHIPNKPVDKTPKVEQPVNETVVKTQETVNNTVQSAPAKTNELPHTGDNDSSKALAVSGLAMFMAGIIGVFRKKKQ